MPNISFDRAADFYDQTRTRSDALVSAILAEARHRPDGRLLEVGVGTGRIAVPLLESGADLFGVDLSVPMMEKLRAKWPAARLGQADATQLPFPAQTFDTVMTFHVLHLVGAWRTALREFRRVLRPGGVYLNTWNQHIPNSVSLGFRTYWRSRVEAHGGQWQRPGLQSREDLLAEAQALGARMAARQLLPVTGAVTPRMMLDTIAGRIYSDSWDLPEDLFQRTIADLRQWAAQEYPDLDQQYVEEHQGVVDIMAWPE